MAFACLYVYSDGGDPLNILSFSDMILVIRCGEWYEDVKPLEQSVHAISFTWFDGPLASVYAGLIRNRQP
jgi:hypothetical protein